MSKKDETIFLTTTQFKALLEVVDSVKSKINSASKPMTLAPMFVCAVFFSMIRGTSPRQK